MISDKSISAFLDVRQVESMEELIEHRECLLVDINSSFALLHPILSRITGETLLDMICDGDLYYFRGGPLLRKMFDVFISEEINRAD